MKTKNRSKCQTTANVLGFEICFLAPILAASLFVVNRKVGLLTESKFRPFIFITWWIVCVTLDEMQFHGDGDKKPVLRKHVNVATEGDTEALLSYKTALQFYAIPPKAEIINLDDAELMVAERING